MRYFNQSLLVSGIIFTTALCAVPAFGGGNGKGGGGGGKVSLTTDHNEE